MTDEAITLYAVHWLTREVVSAEYKRTPKMYRLASAFSGWTPGMGTSIHADRVDTVTVTSDGDSPVATSREKAIDLYNQRQEDRALWCEAEAVRLRKNKVTT